MKCKLKLALCVTSLFVLKTPAYPQATTTPTFGSREDCLAATVNDVRTALTKQDANETQRSGSAMRSIQNHVGYVCYVAWDSIRAQLLTEAELNRMDKQPGATNNSSGSTTLVSKGSSPSILGFAIEHGGFTQTTDGNTITFRGNVVNSITALMKSTYLDSYQLSQDDPVVRYLSKLSFGVSFDTSANQPSTAQGFEPSSKNFSGFSAKYEFYNHRDPRDKRYWPRWKSLADEMGAKLADSIEGLQRALNANPLWNQWKATRESEIRSLLDRGTEITPDDVKKILDGAADSFEKQFASIPQIKNAISTVVKNLSGFEEEKSKTLGEIRKAPILTGEYTLTRQLTSNDKNITATQPGQKIPDLSNVNLVFEKGFVHAGAPEITFDAAGTWFNAPNTADPKRGRVRDIRASLELDWKLTKLTKLDKPTLSFSGQYLNLFTEPLGQKVTLNGVTIDRRGPVDVFQAKLSIPVGSSGVKIPISFTYASRTELVKEKDVRGNVGITFDLDALFSKAK